MGGLRRGRARVAGGGRAPVNAAGIPTIVEPELLSDAELEGVSRADVAALDSDIAELARRRARRTRRRLGVLALVALLGVGVAVWVGLSLSGRWERVAATRSAFAAASEIRASSLGGAPALLPPVAGVGDVGGVAAVVPEVSAARPERFGELGYVVSDDRRSATLTAASRDVCVTVAFAVDSPPEIIDTTRRRGSCELIAPT